MCVLVWPKDARPLFTLRAHLASPLTCRCQRSSRGSADGGAALDDRPTLMYPLDSSMASSAALWQGAWKKRFKKIENCR